MADETTPSTVGYGQNTPEDSNTEFQAIVFLVRQLIAQISTMKLVRVSAVHLGDGSPPAAGTVDVQPLVSQVDGVGNSQPHGIVYGIPWFRLQGGVAGIIIDPAKDDIGYVICADTDSSNVARSKKMSTPGSWRTFDLADGVYVGGVLNDAPTQYLWFQDGGLTLADKNGNKIVLDKNGITITGNFIAGAIMATGNITAGKDTADQIDLLNHTHGGVSTGAAQTLKPTPGT